MGTTLVQGLCVLGMALGPLTCLDADFDAGDPAVRKAHRLWVDDCADCHGLLGEADGKLAASLDPPPPDFKDPCRRLTDEWIERVILSGGASFGGAEAMRPHHELHEEPEVLANLVTFVQTLRDKGKCVPGDPPPPRIESPP